MLKLRLIVALKHVKTINKHRLNKLFHTTCFSLRIDEAYGMEWI